MTDEMATIQDRISKLLAKARGTDNEREAAIFMAKAQEMLARHNLDEAELRARESRDDDPVGSQDYRDGVAKWRLTIAQGCAKLYFCSLLKSGRTIQFVGKPHNTAVAISMTDWLCTVVKRMSREHTGDRAMQADFQRGASIRLYQRLVELYREQNAPPPAAAGPTGNALVVLYRNEETAVADYLSSMNVRAGRKGRGMKLGAAAGAGMAAANTISLNKQVGAERRPSRMLGR
jgi:hypothetical protein